MSIRVNGARAPFVLLLAVPFLLNACATWRVRSDLPGADRPARHVRVTLADGGTLELSDAYVRSDSLVGRAVDPAWRSSGGEPTGVPLDVVASVQDWRLSPVRTGLAVLGSAVVTGGTFLAVLALAVDNDPVD